MLPLSDLVAHFESLGDSSEFGMFQRRIGGEPKGLLRFASAPLPQLLAALTTRFDGIAEPANVELRLEDREYIVTLANCDVQFHTYVWVDEIPRDQLHLLECHKIKFLAERLLGDLDVPSKIFVFRQNEPLMADDLAALQQVLRRFGRHMLLWVMEASAGHPPGGVELINDRLMLGFVRWLAPRDNVHNIDVEILVERVQQRVWALAGAAPNAAGPVALRQRRAHGRGRAGHAITGRSDIWDQRQCARGHRHRVVRARAGFYLGDR